MRSLVFAKIYTMDSIVTQAEWLVVEDDKVAAVGHGHPPVMPFDAVHDYRSYTIVPGFNDGPSGSARGGEP